MRQNLGRQNSLTWLKSGFYPQNAGHQHSFLMAHMISQAFTLVFE